MELLIALMVWAGLLTLLGSYVHLLNRWLTPEAKQGPDPLEFIDTEISPDTWNPPGAKAYAALQQGPDSHPE